LYKSTGASFEVEYRDRGAISLTEVERLRYFERQDVDGPIEVRKAWRYNDLKPRVYYARGGVTHTVSRYVQPIMNVFIDSLPEVHRHNRFQPPEDISSPIDR